MIIQKLTQQNWTNKRKEQSLREDTTIGDPLALMLRNPINTKMEARV